MRNLSKGKEASFLEYSLFSQGPLLEALLSIADSRRDAEICLRAKSTSARCIFREPGSLVACLQCPSSALVSCDVSKRLPTRVSQSHLQIISGSWDKIHLDRFDHLNKFKKSKCALKISTYIGHHVFFKGAYLMLLVYRIPLVRNMEAKIEIK